LQVPAYDRKWYAGLVCQVYNWKIYVHEVQPRCLSVVTTCAEVFLLCDMILDDLL
jgi:hypothetical protein